MKPVDNLIQRLLDTPSPRVDPKLHEEATDALADLVRHIDRNERWQKAGEELLQQSGMSASFRLGAWWAKRPWSFANRLGAAIMLVAAGLLAAAPEQANAGGRLGSCTTHDKWQGADKRLHVGVGLFAGLAVTAATKNPVKGWAYTTAAAAAWELVPVMLAETGHTCSVQDFIVGSAAAAVGAYGGHLAITYGRGETRVSYSMVFQ